MSVPFGERKPVMFGSDNPVPTDWKSYEKLFAELEAQDRYDIELAFIISSNAHAGQVRADGLPFITHVLRATNYLWQAGCRHRRHLVGTLLHDVPEDTTYLETYGAEFYKRGSFERYADTVDPIERLANLFGRDVAELVSAVNKPEGIPHKAARAKKYREQMLEGPMDTGLIKMPDTFDNLTTLGSLNPEKRRRKVREYGANDDVFTRALRVREYREEGLVLYSWYRRGLEAAAV